MVNPVWNLWAKSEDPTGEDRWHPTCAYLLCEAPDGERRLIPACFVAQMPHFFQSLYRAGAIVDILHPDEVLELWTHRRQ